MRGWMRAPGGAGRRSWALPAAAGLLAAAPALGGCITQRCAGDADCPGGQVCNPTAGTCVAPECSTDIECGRGRVCEGSMCVAGCTSDDDCDPPRRCFDRRCALVGDCECPLAPAFCGEDLNPSSATAGASVCVPGGFPGGVAIFFGSIYCGHCQADFAALQTLGAGLRAEGYDPDFAWAQLRTFPATPEQVAERLGAVDVAVFMDSDALDIWGAYAADWYYLILVDTHGCLAGRFGPLTPDDVSGEVGLQIAEAWRAAMSPECREHPPDPADGGDASTDAP